MANSGLDPISNPLNASKTESWVKPCRSIPDAGRRSSTEPLLPDELMWEILIWLPAKSLMRFKCVSRLWKSIIQDSSFSRAYRGGFRGLLISAPALFRLAFETDFYYVSIRDVPGATTKLQLSHQVTVGHGGRRVGSTGVVNGLVCFYDCNDSYLYNIATRERMELPVSIYQAQASTSTYHLGYDPVNKFYKLLKICPVCDEGEIFDFNLNCEILTVGVDSSWRIINPPPLEIQSRSACYGGVLYWLEPKDEPFGDMVQCLIAFHLAQEKFQIIDSPEPVRHGYVPHFGPGLEIVNLTVSDNISKAEIYRPVGGSPEWTKSEITFPPKDYEDEGYAPAGTLPDGKIFIAVNRYIGITFPLSFYLYDPLKEQLEQIVIWRCPAPYKDISGHMYYHEENIMPLSCLNSVP